MRLIDANALYNFVEEQIEKETGAYTRGKNEAFNIVKSALHNECAAPTISPDSLRERGRWVKRKNWDKCVCSECSSEEKEPRKFCPSCGARMDLEG